MTTVLVLCGGQSPEHEISLRSARNVIDALDLTKFSPVLVGIDLSGQWHLLEEIPAGKELIANNPVLIDPGNGDLNAGTLSITYDVVFPVLHGPNGEDGTVQGLFQLLGKPYVGPDVLGSSVAMDKDVAKTQLAAHGVNVAPGKTLHHSSEFTFEELTSSLSIPLFVKPANMGSSVGVHRVTTKEEYDFAIADAFRYDNKVLVEQGINGRELECAVLGLRSGLRVTSPGEISTSEEYSFEEKYSETSQARLDIPALNIDQETIQELKETAIKAFKALQCEIISRVDMFLTDQGEIYVNEINTLPGFTSISMYPKLWENEGLSYSDLITELLRLAMNRE